MYGIADLPLEMTSEWLFDRIDQEDVYRKYFGFCELGKKFVNPLRIDKKADCGFYWYNGILFFKDFAIDKTYTCISVVMEIERLSYRKALWKIYEIFISNTNETSKVSFPAYQHKKTKTYVNYESQIQNFTRLDIEYLKSYGIMGVFCKKARWFSIRYIIRDGIVCYVYTDSDPCIGYYFGDGKWKFYFYKRKEYRFLSNVPSNILQGYSLLKDKEDFIVVTKSFKDIGTLYKFNIPSVAPQAESVILSSEQIEDLKQKTKTIFTLSDYDNAGIHFAWKMRELYGTIPLFLTDKLWNRKGKYKGAKDISDYYKLYGEDETKKLIQNEKRKNIYSV